MSNKYILRIKAIGQFHEMEIDKERFENLKMAGKTLSNALAIEQMYEMIINSFLELECESVNVSISGMVRGDCIEHKDFFDIQLALNVRIVNLLTAVRLYKDQLPKHASVFVSPDEKACIKKFFPKEREAEFEFRFMEELRNHAQHRDFSVHSVSINGRWVELENEVDKKLFEHSLSFYATKKELCLAGGFEPSVLSEMPKEVNLLVAARVYVEAVSRIHGQAREKIKKFVESARVDMDNAISEYNAGYNKDPVGLYALAYQDKKVIDEVSIITKWDDVRKGLVIKNGEIVNLSKSYVSSRAEK